MSRKSKRNRSNEVRPEAQPQPAPPTRRIGRGGIFVAAAIALLLAFVVGTLLYKSEKAQSSQQAATKNRAALASGHSPTFGKADAKVHIVEFLDPACETCAAFYPQVKKLIAANPDRIRLSVRHVPFHQGSDLVVRILEASRNQDKYWQALEALFATQDRWVVHHAVQADRVWSSLGGAGLDLDRIRSDMNAPEISRRIEQDSGDARALGVTKTPEYFVNGRPMPSFGWTELQGLVREELRGAYP
jgi:protein-disulfide isomerase